MRVEFVFAGMLLLGGAVSCGPRVSDEEAESVAAAEADTRARRCGARRPRGVTAESSAVRCAEWFVARNGYTDLPAGPARELASETVEFVRSLDELLTQRRGTLGRKAVAVCRGAGVRVPGTPGFTVAFAAPGEAAPQYVRAVTMDPLFAELRVEHMPLVVAEALADSTTCEPLVGALSGR